MRTLYCTAGEIAFVSTIKHGNPQTLDLRREVRPHPLATGRSLAVVRPSAPTNGDIGSWTNIKVPKKNPRSKT